MYSDTLYNVQTINMKVYYISKLSKRMNYCHIELDTNSKETFPFMMTNVKKETKIESIRC